MDGWLADWPTRFTTRRINQIFVGIMIYDSIGTRNGDATASSPPQHHRHRHRRRNSNKANANKNIQLSLINFSGSRRRKSSLKEKFQGQKTLFIFFTPLNSCFFSRFVRGEPPPPPSSWTGVWLWSRDQEIVELNQSILRFISRSAGNTLTWCRSFLFQAGVGAIPDCLQLDPEMQKHRIASSKKGNARGTNSRSFASD